MREEVFQENINHFIKLDCVYKSSDEFKKEIDRVTNSFDYKEIEQTYGYRIIDIGSRFDDYKVRVVFNDKDNRVIYLNYSDDIYHDNEVYDEIFNELT